MKQTKKMMKSRLLALALAALLLMTALTGCVGAPRTAQGPQVNADAFLSLDEQMHGLSALELKSVAQMLASVYSADAKNTFKSTELLLAAYRGYDMLGEGFNDAEIDPTVAGDPDMAAVLKVLDTANSRADADNKVLFDYSDINEADALVLIESLKTTVELNESRNLWHTILGWIGVALGWLTSTLGGGYYIIGICIFAILMEIVLLPFAIKQQKNSIRQAKLRPKEMAIRKKYAGRDDQVTRQKVAQEIQELYQRENYNAASGCLPLLIQMPILLALYNIVVDPLRYVLGQSSGMSAALNLYNTTARAAGGLGATASTASRGTIEILSQIGNRLEGIRDFALLGNGEAVYDRMSNIKIPNFTLGNINLGDIPSFKNPSILLLVPVLTFVVYFFSMRLTKKFTYQPTNMTAANDKQAACSSWMMDITMPLMSVYIAFIVPALVGIYWIFKSVISTLRQFIVSRVMPYPEFTEEDYRAAEREYAGRAPRKDDAPRSYSYAKGTPMVDGKPRSLFHMDDDDYLAKVEAQQKQDAEQEVKKNASSAIEGETVKQDDRKADKKDNKKN